MSVMNAVPESLTEMFTRSPTAIGLVDRIPLRRKLPLILQSISAPSSVRATYQLPVFFMINASIKMPFFYKINQN